MHACTLYSHTNTYINHKTHVYTQPHIFTSYKERRKPEEGGIHDELGEELVQQVDGEGGGHGRRGVSPERIGGGAGCRRCSRSSVVFAGTRRRGVLSELFGGCVLGSELPAPLGVCPRE